MTTDGRLPTITALTGIRFFAALAVIGTHYNGSSGPLVLRTYLNHGNVGVALFFILSGFVLAYNYERVFRGGLGATRGFYQARFARIYPIHFLMLLFAIVVVAAINWPHSASNTRIALSWVANMLLVQVWFPTVPQWNVPAWSIADEMVFYALFPLIMVGVMTRIKAARTLVIAAAVVWALQVVFVLLGQRRLGGSETGEYHLYHSPIFRCWEFILGVIFGTLIARRVRRGAAYPVPILASRRVRDVALGLTGLLIISIPMLMYLRDRRSISPDDPYIAEKLLYPFYTPLFVVLIVLLASGPTLLHVVLEHRLIILLGEASYSLYLLHAPVFEIIKHMTSTGSMVRFALLLITTPLLIGASVLLYTFVEVPARQRLRPQTQRRTQNHAAPAALNPAERIA